MSHDEKPIQEILWESEDLAIYGSRFGKGPHLIVYIKGGPLLHLNPEGSIAMVGCLFKWWLETHGIGGSNGK